MDAEKKVKVTNIIFQIIIFVFIFIMLGQYVGMLETAKFMKSIGKDYSPSLSLFQFTPISFWIPMLIAGTIGFCSVWFLPIVQWGVALAFRMKATPGSLWFRIIVGFIVACVLVPIFAISMSIVTTVILVPEGGYKATVSVALLNAVRYFWLFFPTAWVIAVLIAKPCENLARLMLKTPAPQHWHQKT